MVRHLISASQLKTWRDCQRKWAFEKVEGRTVPSTDKQIFGTRMHAHLEAWLKNGHRPPDSPTGDAARQIIRPGWLPDPSPTLMVEHSFKWKGFSGIIDVLWRDDDVPIVADHKSTSDLKYALRDLSLDPQALIYSAFAMDWYSVDKVRARWLYSCARGRDRRPGGARMVEHEFIREDPARRSAWAKVLIDSRIMRGQRSSLKSAMEAEPNFASCNKYGGCPYRGSCERSPDKIMSGFSDYFTKKGNSTMNLFDKLKAELQTDPKIVDQSPGPVADEKPKKKRGRPKGVSSSKVNPPKPRSSSMVVIFDAVFAKNETMANGVKNLGDLVEPIAAQIAEENGVEHWGLMEFGKGPHLLASRFDQWLVESPIDGVVLADSATKEAQALRDVLRRRATVVIQAVK